MKRLPQTAKFFFFMMSLFSASTYCYGKTSGTASNPLDPQFATSANEDSPFVQVPAQHANSTPSASSTAQVPVTHHAKTSSYSHKQHHVPASNVKKNQTSATSNPSPTNAPDKNADLNALLGVAPAQNTPTSAPAPAAAPVATHHHAHAAPAPSAPAGDKKKSKHDHKKTASPAPVASSHDRVTSSKSLNEALMNDSVSPSALPFKQMPRSQGIYDLAPLPVYHGVVAQFLPAIQEGGIIGFILTDGTEVLIPTEASDSILRILNVGEKVDIQGLHGRVLPIVQAFAISTARGNVSRGDFIAMPHHSREMMAGTDFILHGDVWLTLYNVEGQLCGAILKDHSVLYMSPSEAVHVVDLLQPGKTLYVVGSGSSGDLGLAVEVREIGPSTDKLVSLTKNTAPPPGPPAGSAAYDIIRGSEER